MAVESNNPDTGIDNGETQAPDTAADWDYYDPDEDQDTVETPEPEVTEDGTEEAVDEADPAEETEASAEIDAPLEAVVTLSDGTKTKVSDLIQGNLRQADYTRKSQELARERQAVEANLQRIEGITEAFIDHLSSMVPAQPDPSLALRDPNAYVRQKAQYDAAVAQVQKLIEVGQQPKQIKDAMTAEQQRTTLAEENRRLAERFPETATQQGRERFFNVAAEAAKEMGIPLDELGAITDHRYFMALHYAKIGMDAVKARAAAKAKAQAAPPAAPRKPGQPVTANRNMQAMQKLARSGSLRDALKVDWD